MDNIHQYLLSVAEKIINQYADKKAVDKYFSLKSRLTQKYTYQTQNSHLALSTLSKDTSKCSIMKTSIAVEDKKKKSRCKSRQSISKSKANDDLRLSKGRVQSYSSKVTERSNNLIQQSDSEGYQALLHAATLIKNAELCPSILKTITFYPNSFNENINKAFDIIASSLSAIYNMFTLQQDHNQNQISKENHSEMEQIIKDNKWLMSKLEIFLGENTSLRRMVGHRIY